MIYSRPAVSPENPPVNPEDLVDLSVVVPAYNEAQRIGSTLDRIGEYLAASGRTWEVLVVDDGSRDDTLAVVGERCSRHPEMRALPLGVNRGKGAAVRHGVLSSRGKVVLFSDADLSTPIEELEKLLSRIQEGHHVAFGSRDTLGSKIEVAQPLYRRLMGYTFMVLRDWIAVSGFRDSQCGFKMFERAAAREIFSRARIDRFSFDVEILMLGKFLGLTMIEVPVIWRNDDRSRLNPLSDPFRMFVDLFVIRWNVIRGVYGRPAHDTTPGGPDEA